jgi:hypothetical protein
LLADARRSNTTTTVMEMMKSARIRTLVIAVMLLPPRIVRAVPVGRTALFLPTISAGYDTNRCTWAQHL